VFYFHTVPLRALADAARKRMLGRNVADEDDPPSSTVAKAPEPVIWNTEDVEDIWAEMDDLSDEIEGVKDSVGLLLMSDEQSW